MNMMLSLKKISRQQLIAAGVIVVGIVAGAVAGFFSISATGLVTQNSADEPSAKDAPFVLPASPPVKKAVSPVTEDAAQLAAKSAQKAEEELADQRMWEATAKQPLPPRKEPMTPPRWRVVGITSVGSVKSVLLLFENQPVTEARGIGDKLPGGAKIVDIAQDHLKIVLNGQTMKLNLRKQ
ncbi:hypothetical protein [Undibacterium aquatile]|uniref:Type II secretion system protein GspC N-terminal domain-containing protein n=1 Tax=Undibacterium aquatile TaxID=1537398 RepID=A0ABR6XHW8_9BURK|nr:hypothetical protein [Undibacterium aquatile]MBC3812492.1 hypothetical protein [Undibacterium aquatile]